MDLYCEHLQPFLLWQASVHPSHSLNLEVAIRSFGDSIDAGNPMCGMQTKIEGNSNGA